ncbi:MAG: HAMP domain-containing sensor histidine kinase [Sporolactobacillus sp.]
MGDLVIRKLITITLLAVSAVAALIAFFALSTQLPAGDRYDGRQMRVDCNALTFAVERAEKNKTFAAIRAQNHFAVIDLTGRVRYSRMPGYAIGTLVNLHTLAASSGSDLAYTVPVTHDGRQFGTLVIALNKRHYQLTSDAQTDLFAGEAVAALLIICCLIAAWRLINRDIFRPTRQLRASTQAILGGDFSRTVAYDYDGIVGGLCHDFDKMRAELEESRRREQQQQKREKLLLASISHDLKTPIAAVSGYAEGIVCGVVESPVDIRRYAALIEEKAALLNQLIDDIRTHTQTESGQFTIHKQIVYCQSFFMELISGLAADATSHSIELTHGKWPDGVIDMDAKRITQVMNNLVDNACKYGHSGGHIHITFSKRSAPHPQLITSVRDDGAGIAAVDLPFIFDRFYRGDKARTHGIAGMGLGLSIARSIIERHGGQIACDSVLGAGTTITFSLPFA